MIFAALLESGTGAVHAVNERFRRSGRRARGRHSALARAAALALALLAVCMLIADRVGLVALIANGYRALAYVLIAVYVVPLLTIGVWRLWKGGAVRMGDIMKKFFALVLMVSSLPAWAAPPAKFEARVEAVRKAAEVPGMAIAIVENGNVTLARGFGVRKLGSPEKVDGDTIFMTGSTGKA